MIKKLESLIEKVKVAKEPLGGKAKKVKKLLELITSQ